MQQVVNKNILLFYPTDKFKEWFLATAKQAEIEVKNPQFNNLACAFIVPQLNTEEDFILFLRENYTELVQEVFGCWIVDAKLWPSDMFADFHELMRIECGEWVFVMETEMEKIK